MVILRLWSRYPIVIVIVSHQINRNCVNLFIGIIREHSWIPICMFALLYNDDDLVLFPVTDVLDSMQFTVIKLKDLVEGENESLEWGLLLRGRIFKGVKIFIIRTSSGRRISDQQLYWSQFQPVNSNGIVFICNQTGCSLRCISNDCSLIWATISIAISNGTEFICNQTGCFEIVQQFDRSLNISVINIFFLVDKFTCHYTYTFFMRGREKIIWNLNTPVERMCWGGKNFGQLESGLPRQNRLQPRLESES